MDNPTGPILVYGANGGQGSAVVRAALAAGRKVRVLLRDGSSHPFGDAVEVARADLSDPASLARASAGVAGVYLMIPVRADRDEIVQWGRNAIDAAVEAGVGMLVFNTSGPGSRTAVGVAGLDAKLEVEACLSHADMPSVTLRDGSTWTISPSPGPRLRSFTMAFWLRVSCRSAGFLDQLGRGGRLCGGSPARPRSRRTQAGASRREACKR